MSLTNRFMGSLRLAKLPKIIKPDLNLPESEIPPIIDYHLLPSPIKQWIDFSIKGQYTSSGNASTVARGKMPYMMKDPASYYRKGTSPIKIPNPFLRHRMQLDTELFLHDQKPETTVISPISRQLQKYYARKYPRYILPPSTRNPLSNPPLIRKDDMLLRYSPNWTYFPQVKKGLYAGRVRLFKGHRRERIRHIRKQEIADRMEGMERRIEKWRTVSCRALSDGSRQDADSHGDRTERRRRKMRYRKCRGDPHICMARRPYHCRRRIGQSFLAGSILSSAHTVIRSSRPGRRGGSTLFRYRWTTGASPSYITMMCLILDTSPARPSTSMTAPLVVVRSCSIFCSS